MYAPFLCHSTCNIVCSPRQDSHDMAENSIFYLIYNNRKMTFEGILVTKKPLYWIYIYL